MAEKTAAESLSELMSVKIYDMAIQSGGQMSGVDRSTVENLLNVFQSEPNGEDAVRMLCLYIARQAGRREIDRSAARSLLENIRKIRDACKGDQEELRKVLLKYLILLKWVYESGGIRAKNFEEWLVAQKI